MPIRDVWAVSALESKAVDGGQLAPQYPTLMFLNRLDDLALAESVSFHFDTVLKVKTFSPYSQSEFWGGLQWVSKRPKTPVCSIGNRLQSLFGAYQSDESADEIIKKIRGSRVFKRSIESL